MTFLVITRGEAKNNPLIEDTIKNLALLNINFNPKSFEYTSPQDFIYYHIDENCKISFAMKVLFCSNNFKIVDLYSDNQLIMLLSFVNFRSLIVKTYNSVIDNRNEVNILWNSEICNTEIRNFATLSNIMGTSTSTYNFTLDNKDKIHGNDIEFPKPPLLSTVFNTCNY